jgi:hypothetical protein
MRKIPRFRGPRSDRAQGHVELGILSRTFSSSQSAPHPFLPPSYLASRLSFTWSDFALALTLRQPNQSSPPPPPHANRLSFTWSDHLTPMRPHFYCRLPTHHLIPMPRRSYGRLSPRFTSVQPADPLYPHNPCSSCRLSFTWSDFALCKWPANLLRPGDTITGLYPAGVAAALAQLNEPAIAEVNAALRHGVGDAIFSFSHFLPREETLPDWCARTVEL